MKKFEELEFNPKAFYAKTHEWALKTGEDRIIIVGISDYAQSALSEVVFVDLPDVGMAVNAGAAFGSIESVKSVNDLHSPVTGKVSKVNGAVTDEPGLVNKSPHGEGWLIEIEASPEGAKLDAELGALLASDAYAERLKKIDGK